MHTFLICLLRQSVRIGLCQSGFIEDLISQLADSSNRNRFVKLFMAIKCQQEIGYQAGKHLDHKAMAAS